MATLLLHNEIVNISDYVRSKWQKVAMPLVMKFGHTAHPPTTASQLKGKFSGRPKNPLAPHFGTLDFGIRAVGGDGREGGGRGMSLGSGFPTESDSLLLSNDANHAEREL